MRLLYKEGYLEELQWSLRKRLDHRLHRNKTMWH